MRQVFAPIAAFALAASTSIAHAGGDVTPSKPAESRVESHGSVARLAVARDRITTAERLKVSLSLTTPADADGSLPAIGPTLGEWRVFSASPHETRRTDDGGLVRGADLVLEPFLPGDYEIPALEFPVTSAGGPRTLRTAPVLVHVESVLAKDDTEIGPQRGMLTSLPSRSRLWWTVGIGAGVLAVGAGGAVIVRSRRRHARTPLPEPWHVARLELERLLSRMSWTEKDATGALDAAASVLGGWSKHVALASAAAGVMGPPESERRTREDTARRLEREIEERRFSGAGADPFEARRLAEDVMRISAPGVHVGEGGRGGAS